MSDAPYSTHDIPDGWYCLTHGTDSEMFVMEVGPHCKGYCARCQMALKGPGEWVPKPASYQPYAPPSLFEGDV